MLANIFLILVCYYIIKTVREPLILTTTVPESLQALGIRGAGRGEDLRRRRPGPPPDGLRAGLQLVRVAGRPDEAGAGRDRLLRREHPRASRSRSRADVDHVGVFFYVWVGIFSLSIIAQFWSYANDIYTKDAGNRLFPMIGIGMTAGSPLGAWIAGRMFERPPGDADHALRGGRRCSWPARSSTS